MKAPEVNPPAMGLWCARCESPSGVQLRGDHGRASCEWCGGAWRIVDRLHFESDEARSLVAGHICGHRPAEGSCSSCLRIAVSLMGRMVEAGIIR